MSNHPDTLIYINSKGKNSRTGKLSPKQFRWLKPLSQEERGKWLQKIYEIESKERKRIYDENFEDPTAIHTDCEGEPVDVCDLIHQSLEEYQTEVVD